MAAPNRSFAQRMASMASNTSNTSKFESWDDGDFEDSDGLLFKNSAIQTLSSRMSVRSESNTGDDDWQVLITPNDDLSTNRAIHSAKQAGIPIPTSVPSSALLGGTIKRLGKKKSTRKMDVDDDWANDLELPSHATGGLKLKTPTPHTPAEEHDDFDDWGEGSLGIRFAGTRRDTRGARSSSVSAMSPSMGSCMTLESEDDDLNGLVLPTEPLDFGARLEKLKKTQLPTPDASPLPQQREQPPTSAPTSTTPIEFPSSPFLSPFPSSPAAEPTASPRSPRVESPAAPALDSPFEQSPKSKPKPVQDEEDFLDGLDFGGGDLFDSPKLTLNRNVVVKKPEPKAHAPPAARPATTITFTDRPNSSRIPRPLPSTASRSRLTPVYESGASTTHTQSRPMPTTTSAQLLRAKRSAPLLRNSNLNPARGHVPFLPAGSGNAQSHHVQSRGSQPQLRRDSDPNRRPQSPSMRPYSRAETPSRTGVRRDLAPSALARHPPPKKLTQPQRKRNYGDGHELDSFDDLPTSATKEKVFEKAPRNVASNKSLRQQPSLSRLPMPDRMATPMPQTPRSPPKMDHTPRFARDTAASRNAREQRLAGTRSRADGPMAPRPMSWAAQVAARSPHTSPVAHKKKGSGQKPQLIRQMTQPNAFNEKGMVFNPTLQRWEGNEEILASFTTLPNSSTTTLALTTASTPTFAPPGHPFNRSHDRSRSISHNALSSIHAAQKSFSSRMAKIAPPPAPAAPVPVPSPPRPALISHISAPRGVLHEGRMVFDPVKMKWLKAARHSNDPRAPSELDDEEEDPFAGIEDFKDNESVAGRSNAPGDVGSPAFQDGGFVGEEFDVGPGFIRRQREEEAIWRRRVEGWVGGLRDSGDQRGGWKWAIREFAASASSAY